MATKRKVFHFTPFDQQSLDLLVKRLGERNGIAVSQIDAVRWAIDKGIEATNPDKDMVLPAPKTTRVSGGISTRTIRPTFPVDDSEPTYADAPDEA